jgi:hypothetical protein
MTAQADAHSVIGLPERPLHSGTCQWVLKVAKDGIGSEVADGMMAS